MLDIRIDTAGTLERLRAQMAAMPEGVERAQARALRKLATWANRQILREVASASGATQKALKAALRYRATVSKGTLNIWIGTNPIKAHHLGRVRWTPRMQGARVGRRLYPGAWSQPAGKKTAGLVMQRLTEKRLPIELVTVQVNDQVLARVEQIKPEIDARFQTLLIQELNYALNVEAART